MIKNYSRSILKPSAFLLKAFLMIIAFFFSSTAISATEIVLEDTINEKQPIFYVSPDAVIQGQENIVVINENALIYVVAAASIYLASNATNAKIVKINTSENKIEASGSFHKVSAHSTNLVVQQKPADKFSKHLQKESDEKVLKTILISAKDQKSTYFCCFRSDGTAASSSSSQLVAAKYEDVVVLLHKNFSNSNLKQTHYTSTDGLQFYKFKAIPLRAPPVV
jgi:hypothetical protein